MPRGPAAAGAAGPPQVRASGGVVWRVAPTGDAGIETGDAGIEVVLVHRPRYDDWSFPKGKVDPGESDEQAALREVEEEAGMRCALGDELPSVRYLDAKGRDKVVRYWAMTPVAEVPWHAGDEVDDRRWVPVVEAARLLSYHHDRDVLAVFTDARPGG